MNTSASVCVLLAACVLVILPARAESPSPKETDTRGVVARGRYIVERIAMCQDCHTPRTQSGEFDRERWLQGGPLWYRPAREALEWAEVVPPIAGLPGWLEDEAVIRFLMTGQRADGTRPRPPMKQYHMERDDAAAVVAYLRSLAPVRK